MYLCQDLCYLNNFVPGQFNFMAISNAPLRFNVLLIYEMNTPNTVNYYVLNTKMIIKTTIY